jgi:peptidylprolyl isomerase
MRFVPYFAIASVLTVAMAACNSATLNPGCEVIPTRVVSTSGDTLQTVSGLRYMELSIGSGAEVRTCTKVEVGYVGRLEDGTVFDSGTIPEAIPGGRMGFIPGFEQALIGMREGGTRRAFIPPYLAYGATGTANIPPNATLIFDLEARSVTE